MRNGLSCSEAGRIGALKTAEIQHRAKLKRIEEYNKDPQRCKFCKEPIPYEKKCLKVKFCSSSCAASYNNKITKKKNRSKCLNCDNLVKSTRALYCSSICQQEYAWKKRKEFFETNGFFEGSNNDSSIRKMLKKYILEKNGHKCSICSNTEWMGKPIPLILDHINGNPEDHKEENLRLVCGNCDMQLPTYKSKNKVKTKEMVENIEDKDTETEKVIKQKR